MTEREERRWASFAHLAVLLGVVLPFASVVAPLAIYIFKGERSRFVRFHAAQSVHLQLIDMTLTVALVGFGIAAGVSIGEPLLDPAWTLGFPVYAPLGYAAYAMSLFTFIYPLTISAGARNGEWKGYPLLERWLPPAPEPGEGMEPLEGPGSGARYLGWTYAVLVPVALLAVALAMLAPGRARQRDQQREDERAAAAMKRDRELGEARRLALAPPDLSGSTAEELIEIVRARNMRKPTPAHALDELKRRGPAADAAIARALADRPADDAPAGSLVSVLEGRERIGPEFLPGLRKRAEVKFPGRVFVSLYCRIEPLPASELPLLLKLAGDASSAESDRAEPVSALRRLPAEATGPLVERVQDGSAFYATRAAAALGLGCPAHASEEAVAALRKVLTDPAESGPVPVAAARALGAMGPAGRVAIPDLAALLAEEGSVWRAQPALEEMDPEGRALLREATQALKRKESEQVAAEEAGKRTREAVGRRLAQLTPGLFDRNARTRLASAQAIGALGADAAPAAKSLVELIESESEPELSIAAVDALRKIGRAAIDASLLPRAARALKRELEVASSPAHRRSVEAALAEIEGPAPLR